MQKNKMTTEVIELFQNNLTERDHIVCTKKCIDLKFKTQKDTKFENRCLKNCHGLRSHLSFEYFNTLNEYTSHINRPAKINN